MSEDSIYKDADIVWVKLGSSWWPGEVYGHQRQPEGFLQQAKRKPYCVVKFFQEDSFEYVKTSKHILHFNCSKKDEFIRKGHELFKAKKKFMEKFPSDVSTAERLTRSVTRSSLFFNTRPDSIVKAILGESPSQSDHTQNGRRCDNITKIINITPNRNSGVSPSSNSPPTYKCSLCDFQSTRQNVMVLHRKSHSNTPTTPSRNSLVNVSAMTLLSEIISHKKSATKIVPVETPSIKAVILQTPVDEQISSPLLDDTVVVISDESDNSSDENVIKRNSVVNRKCDLPLKQNDLIAEVHAHPVNRKDASKENLVKGNSRKSEEIQKSLLADWIDEDKDDEEENEKYVKEEIKADCTQVIPNVNPILSTQNCLLTTVVSEQLKEVEPVGQIECLITPDHQKPSPKIRNIPKKDRRNIVFTDFNNSSESLNVGTLLQHNSDSVCRQEKSLFECNSPIIEHSAVEPSKLEPPTGETPNINSHIVELPNMAPHIPGLSFVEPAVMKPPTLGGTKVEESVDKLYTVEPTSVKLSIEESELSTVVDTKEPASDETLSNNPIAFKSFKRQLLTVKKSTPESTVTESIVEPSAINLRNLELSTVGSSTIELSKVNDLMVQPTTVKASKLEKPIEEDELFNVLVDSSTRKTSTVQPPLRALSIVDASTRKEVTEKLSAKSSDMGLPTIELPTESIKETSTIVLPDEESSITGDSSVTKTSTIAPPVESFAVELPATSLSSIELSTRKTSAIEPPAIRSSVVELDLSTVDTSAKKIVTIESPTAESSAVGLASTTQWTTVESDSKKTTIEQPAVELHTIALSTVDSSTTEPNSAQSSIAELPNMDLSESKTSDIEPPIAKLSAVELATTVLSAMDTSTGKTSTLEPLAEESSAVELLITAESSADNIKASTIEPSTADSFMKEPGKLSKADTSTYETPIVKQSTAETLIVNQSTVKESTIKVPQEETSTVKLSKADASTHETSTVKQSAPETFIVNQSTIKESTFKVPPEDTSTIKLSAVEAYIVESSIVKQFTVEPATSPGIEEPSTERPCIIETCTEKLSPTLELSALEPINKKAPLAKSSTAKIPIVESFHKSFEINLPLTGEQASEVDPSLSSLDSSSVVPCTAEQFVVESSTILDNLQPKTINQMESKAISSASKASLSCFDFEEEEESDILTSIAKFKKKYVSPEKNHELGKDNRPKTPDTQKIELELKDKQLSADIESLLKTTELPVELAAPSSMIERSISYDVRGLPIKERGKRIFKSRNRFRPENCYSVSTTSTIKVMTKTSSPTRRNISKKKISSTETCNTKQSHDAMTNVQVEEKSSSDIRVNSDESSIDMPQQQKEEAMDDKVTNSEEEIVGRVVFSPAEVYASSAETYLHESPDNRESHVSSSGMEVHTESVSVSDENIKADIVEGHFNNYTNESHPKSSDSDLGKIDDVVKESQMPYADSCDVDNKGQTDYILSLRQAEQLVDKHEFLQQEVQEDHLNAFFVVEESEPIYEVEVYDADVSSKPTNSNVEISNEYELITTEVTNVDRITSDEGPNTSSVNANENISLVSITETSEIVTCSADRHLLKEIICTEASQLPLSTTDDIVTESQDSSIPDDVETDNYKVVIKDMESTDHAGNPSEESNSCSTIETESKHYYLEKDTHAEPLEHESIHTEVERAETSSDDTSTVISDAEAEFGSPTSMLEEERVLNRGKLESEATAINIEYVNNVPKGKGHKDKVLNKTVHMTRYQLQGSRKEKRLLLTKSLNYDTQESASNDVEQNASNLELDDKEHKKEGIKKKEQEQEPKSKEEEKNTSQKKEDISDKEENIIVQEEDPLDSSSESDSAEDEEEEICSPPIEPLQDVSREEESTDTFSESQDGKQIESLDNIGSRKQDQQFEKETIIKTSNKSKLEREPLTTDVTSESPSQCKPDQIVAVQNNIPLTSTFEKKDTQTCKSSGTYYTVTQKTDTIIRLNKYKERPVKVEILNESNTNNVNKSNIDDKKAALAGEELSAAEALLLIPNQPSEMFDKSHTNEKLIPFLLDKEIKEEPLENNEQISTAPEQKSEEEIPKEVVRRKRRSHMKVTPRKRVIDVQKSVKSIESNLTYVGAKIPKLAQDPKASVSKLAQKSGNQESHKKTFAEQYEDNFVLKYMKEQSIEDMDAVESARGIASDSDKSSSLAEKPTPEKVHISVDISNPLSSQIASILGTHRPSVSEVISRSGAKKRKQTLEDDIPSFIIKRPNPKTVAEAEAADRETIAQIQNLCPHVEITRKSSKDDQSTSAAQSVKPQIINQQILRAGNNQPTITVTAKSKKPEDGMFDISSMPIVLSNEAIMNEKLHLVITPTSNPQVIKQFQNQQLVLSPRTSASGFTTAPVSISSHGIPIRRPSNVRTKRTPSRQQLQEQQNQEHQNQQQKSQQQQEQEQENQLQQNQPQHQNQHQQQNQQQPNQHQQNLQQQYHQQHQLLQQQHHQMVHNQQNQRQQQQLQLQHQPQFQQHQHFQQQFQQHHQNQIQQQLEEEQHMLIQQHQQQIVLQQQLQMQQHQHQLQIHQQLISSEKATHTNSSDKQMGVDTRGNKYVIIKAPPNTVVMGNNAEPNKAAHRLQQQQVDDNSNTNTQRKQRQSASTSKKALPLQPPLPVKSALLNHLPLHVKSPHPHIPPALSVQSTLPYLPPIPVQSSLHHQQSHQNLVQAKETHSNEIPPHFKLQQIAPLSIPDLPTTTTKAKTQGRGRRPKQPKKIEATPLPKESAGKNVRNNGKSARGGNYDPPRQRLTRSMELNKKNNLMKCSEAKKSVDTNFIPATTYSTTQQQTQSVVFMASPQLNTASSSPILCTNNMPFQVQTSSLSPQMVSQVITGIPIETSNGAGVGYAVPSLPIPGYPQTFLLCELINKKYKEVSSKPLYLSQDRTRFFEVPEELVTEAHRKLTDCRREPNPDVLQVVSGGVPHVLQPRMIEINTKAIVEQMQQEQKLQQQDNLDKNVKPNEALIQKQDQLSVEEQASALLCLQEQIVQEQIAQEQLALEQLAQKQLAQEQLVQEQLVQEQLVQEQLVQDQLVQDQIVQEQLVQDQFSQEQFVQEQFIQEQFDQERFVQEQFVQEQFVQEQFMQEGEQGILQVATIETEEVQDNLIQHIEPTIITVDRCSEDNTLMVLNMGHQQMMIPEEVFNNLAEQHNDGDGSVFTLSASAISELFSMYASRPIDATITGELVSEICDQQQIVMDENILTGGETSADILTVSLDESGLYSEEQFINSGNILQIETAEGLRLISTTDENSSIVFHPMTSIETKTSETNVLTQTPKMSTVEIVSDRSKSKFETDPSTSASLEDCLNVIGVPSQGTTVPISLELPTTVTNSAIVSKTRTPTPGTITMNEIIATGLCHHPDITSLPSMGSDEQELHYEFFPSGSDASNDKVHEESVVADMGEYAVVSSGESFDDPGR